MSSKEGIFLYRGHPKGSLLYSKMWLVRDISIFNLMLAYGSVVSMDMLGLWH